VTTAEEAGFESVWHGEHVVVLVSYSSPYPFSETGEDGARWSESGPESLRGARDMVRVQRRAHHAPALRQSSSCRSVTRCTWQSRRRPSTCLSGRPGHARRRRRRGGMCWIGGCGVATVTAPVSRGLDLRVAHLDHARTALVDAGVRIVREARGMLVLDPSDTGDVEVVLVDRLLPGDLRPRRGASGPESRTDRRATRAFPSTGDVRSGGPSGRGRRPLRKGSGAPA
jgi:hypothetical protein